LADGSAHLPPPGVVDATARKRAAIRIMGRLVACRNRAGAWPLVIGLAGICAACSPLT
jgi:hypothetical protein